MHGEGMAFSSTPWLTSIGKLVVFHEVRFTFFFIKLNFSHPHAYGLNCRSTENDFVKSSLPAKLQRIRTFGSMKLEAFRDLISEEAYEFCQKEKSRRTTWYSLTVDVFVAFLFKVIILSTDIPNTAYEYGQMLFNYILCFS